MLKNAQIASAVAAAEAARSAKTAITADYVLETIRETVERCAQHRPVLDKAGNPVMVTTPDGEVVPAFTFDSAGVLKGSELLGKHIGLFPNKTQWSGELKVKNEAAIPCPQTYDEWLAYQRTEEPPDLIALPAPKQVNGR